MANADIKVDVDRELNFDTDLCRLSINVELSGEDLRALDSTLLKQLSEALSNKVNLSFKFYVLEKLFRALEK